MAFPLVAALGPASAQGQKPFKLPALTGDPVADFKAAKTATNQKILTDVETALQQFGDFIANDTTSAADLAISIPELQDGNGQICFDAMASASKVFKANPLPPANSDAGDIGLVNILERIRLLAMTVNNVCNIPACTQVFADATGALAAAAPLKTPIPSLHDLCSSVPNIAVAKPTRTLAAPATAPAK